LLFGCRTGMERTTGRGKGRGFLAKDVFGGGRQIIFSDERMVWEDGRRKGKKRGPSAGVESRCSGICNRIKRRNGERIAGYLDVGGAEAQRGTRGRQGVYYQGGANKVDRAARYAREGRLGEGMSLAETSKPPVLGGAGFALEKTGSGKGWTTVMLGGGKVKS